MGKINGRKGILGGTFDPPHFGHLIIAENARDQFRLAEVIWIPAQTPPHKKTQTLSPADVRAEMVRRIIRDNDAFAISDIELRRDKTSYTVDTIAQLQSAQPLTEFYLIIGGDSLCDFHTWHRSDEILDRVPLLVYDRPDFSTRLVSRDIMACAQFINSPQINISSTDVRKRAREGRSIRYLVTDAVRRYIDQKGLYR